jgi:hypothetical protein
MHKMTLTNSFHGTSVVVLVHEDVETQQEAYVEIEHAAAVGRPGADAKLRRVRRTLCGVADCHCGTVR